MREYTHDDIQSMSEKLRVTKKNAGYFLEMYKEQHFESLKNKSDRMVQCLDLMVWDKYEKNRVLDLYKVNRCKDRFCPNCRSVANAQAIVNFQNPFKLMMEKGYNPYLLTLTIKNVPADELKMTIDKMQKQFRKFFQWMNQPIGKNLKGFKGRIFDIRAAIKALEITVEQTRDGYYHPHFHIMCFIENDNETDFNKYIFDGVRRKGGVNLLSDADVFVSKLWTMAYDGVRINQFDKLPDEVNYTDRERNYYMCDIRPLQMPDGVYEVFKYCFKDTDIKTYQQFKTIYESVNGRRLKQGHGELYNLKLDFDDDEMQKDLNDDINTYLEIEEAPSRVMTRALEELTTTYKAYKKISRFRGAEHIDFNL